MLRVPLRPSFVAQLDRAHAIVGRSPARRRERRRAAAHHPWSALPSEQCVHDRCKTMLQQNHPVFLARQTELEAVMRAWWRDLHAEMEGYAQAIGTRTSTRWRSPRSTRRA